MLRGAIKETTERGDLAVIIYTVLGYPDFRTSKRALDILKINNITVFETAIPVRNKYPPDLNESIINAHKIACLNNISQEDVLDTYSNFRPNFYIIHEGTEYNSVEQLIEKMKKRVDSVLFPWNEEEIDKNYEICQKSRIRVSQSVSPRMNMDKVIRVLNYADGIIYLTSAPKTGDRRYTREEISSSIGVIKSIRDDIPVCCGFGIRNDEDVREVGSIEGCDGVIIGTAVLDILSKGLDKFEEYVKAIINAAKSLKR